MNEIQIKEILEKHKKWLHNDKEGERANLSEANLSKANLYGANLSVADLSGAYLFGADLSKANLSGANLSEADLSWANLFGANLSGANLSRANLYGAYLSMADLSWANLSEADLSWANLSRANLSRANLYRADLYRANLSGAKIEFNIFPSIRLLSSIPLNDLSDKLTLELMRRDAFAHPHPELFDEWAKGGKCPYQNEETFWQFKVNKKLWKKGKPQMRDSDLIMEICKEKKWKRG